VEVGALEVIHGLKALLPHGVLLIMNKEKRDRHLSCSDEVAVTQGGEGDVCHLLDGGVKLAVDDDPYPWVHGVEGYRHVDLAHVQAMGLRQTTTIEGNIPVVAETDECFPKHSREPRAVLAYGHKTPIIGDGEVGVVVHVHLKIQP
jgi:hypothetical protein